MFRKNSQTQVHLVGIGGIGMSGIAEVLLQMNVEVSGSDIQESSITEGLRKRGATISIGHRKENIKNATVLVYSSAIKNSNPEFSEARKKNIPLIRRAEMLSELMRLKHGLAVAGTHGKTTTTSMLATILTEGGIDPTYIVGGIIPNLGGHARVGSSQFLVAEADESDGSFLLLAPTLSLITNIDNDHLDHYKNEDRLREAFVKFANRVPFYGACALNVHDPHTKYLLSKLKRPWVTFGIETDAHYCAKNLQIKDFKNTYDLYYKDQFQCKIEVCPPGRHNVLNSLGAITLAHLTELDFPTIAEGIKKFKGVGRRFELLYKDSNREIIDDYAHHPTEIINTLETLRQITDAKLVVIFEPHRYNRTQQCWSQFLHCFNAADQLVIAPIYPAGEEPLPGITGDRLVEDINRLHPGLATYLEDWEDFTKIFKTEDQTVFLTLGAGSIGRRIRSLVEGFSWRD